jgi:hypothetical protein
LAVPVSFIIACYLEDAFVVQMHVIVPELDNGKKVWYALKESVEADCAKVFYVDRLANMRPHIVRFLVE